MKECKPLAVLTTHNRVDEEFPTELEGLGIAVDVALFDVPFADVVILDPVSKLNDSVEVGLCSVDVAPFNVPFTDVVVLDPVSKLNDSVEVGLCSVAVFEELLISVFPTQHAGVPSGLEQQYCSDEQPPKSGSQHLYPAGRQPLPQDTLPCVAHPPPPPDTGGQSGAVLSQQMATPVAPTAQVWVEIKQPIKPPLQQLQSGDM